MTVQIQTQTETTLPAWEANFFAGVMLEAAEIQATEAQKKHETAATSYIASLEAQDRTKVIVARTNLSHSLKRLHGATKSLNRAKAESNLTSRVTIAQ